MADFLLDYENDSTYGDNDSSDGFDCHHSMFPPPATIAGTKRSADHQDAQTIAPALVSTKECKACEETCYKSGSESRPSKRKASAVDVAAFHKSPDDLVDQSLEPDQQFPDVCFEQFCQDCNWDTLCSSPPCSLPCPEAECGSPPCSLPCPEKCEQEACWDPDCENTCDDAHCDQKYCVQRGHCDQQPCVEQCIDQCIDPECTKKSNTNEPCFCRNCHVQPCPLGEADSDCHFAHTGPTPVGTIYCYDSAPCHFQEGLHGFSPSLASYESYPCYSQSHGTWDHCHSTTQDSSAATPSLSYHTSLESTFSSPGPNQIPTQPSCFLNIPTEHCHIDNACCHGDSRACGDDPTASPEYLAMFNRSIAPGNALANNMTDFGLGFDYPSLAPRKFDHSMLAFNNSWMNPTAQYPNPFSPLMTNPATKLDLLASAVQIDLMKTEVPSDMHGFESARNLGSDIEDQQASICKWQHSPGMLCLAYFDSAEALHKHIKTAHVDNCNRSFCQWEGCEAASKDFKQRSKLSRHLLGHAGYRPYACSFDGCDKTFATNQAKANHERTHTGDRPYECKQCGYTTTTYTQLQTHISALHEGKKPHKCRFCDFSCADSSNLSKHERTHQVSQA
jgi:hypothetical protein